MKELFGSLSIKQKVIINVFIPIFALIMAFYYMISDKKADEQALLKVSELTELSRLISEVVHEWQKERGMTAGYLSSGGKKFSDKILVQRDNADEKMKNLSNYLNTFNALSFGEQLDQELKEVLELNQKRSDFRKRVSNLDIPKGEAIAYYTKVNGKFLDIIGFSAGLSPNVEVTKRVIAYYNFLLGKERAGIERAVLTGAFAVGAFDAGSYTKFCNLVSAQDSYMSIFHKLASAPQSKIYKDTIVQEKLNNVNKMRDVAYSVNLNAEKEFGIKPEVWFDTITEKIELLKSIDDQLAKDINQLCVDLAGEAQAKISSIYSMSFIVLAITLVLFFIITQAIVSPIVGSANALKDISEGDADLTQRLPQQQGKENETGRLSRYFNNFVSTIHSVVKDVQEVNHKLKDSSMQGSELSKEMKETAENLKSNATNVATAIEQMSSNLTGVSSSGENISNMMKSIAAAAAEMAATVQDMANQCSESAEQARDANEKSNESSKVMNGLQNAAEKIGAVVDTISDIADKTDLLALNATIEAASAGEAGKGFAVVASEIKDLSRQTQGATGEISKLIEDIRNSATEASDSSSAVSNLITDLNNNVKNLAVNVEQMSATAQEVNANISEASNDVNQISSSIIEISQGANEITDNVHEVRNLADSSEKSALKSQVSAEELSGYAEQVSEKVGSFRV